MENQKVHNVPSEADADGSCVHVHGPSNLDVSLTPEAALETAKRISDAAVEVILEHALLSARLCEVPATGVRSKRKR
jgi:hypothetical protein